MAVGDFNADGQLDLAIASTFAEVDGETQSGLTYVLSSPFAAGTFDLASAPPHFAIGGADAGDQMGHSIAAGDWDDDGVIDLWLGSVSADGENNAADLTGEARLFLIRPGQSGRIGADEAYGLMLGPSLGARLGRNAISAQLNTDPGAEVAIAATDVNDRRGAVYVVAADQPPPARADDAELTYEGRDEDDILGHEAFGNPSMNSVDLDDDDVSELIIAAPGSDGPDASRPDCGEVYVIVADAKG
jgi:hypothetical protein